jgi:hypothetical protein
MNSAIPCTRKILRVHSLFGSLAWASDHARVAWSSPATWAGLGPAQKKILQKNSFKKSVIFRKYFTAF